MDASDLFTTCSAAAALTKQQTWTSTSSLTPKSPLISTPTRQTRTFTSRPYTALKTPAKAKQTNSRAAGFTSITIALDLASTTQLTSDIRTTLLRLPLVQEISHHRDGTWKPMKIHEIIGLSSNPNWPDIGGCLGDRSTADEDIVRFDEYACGFWGLLVIKRTFLRGEERNEVVDGFRDVCLLVSMVWFFVKLMRNSREDGVSDFDERPPSIVRATQARAYC